MKTLVVREVDRQRFELLIEAFLSFGWQVVMR